jgi:hypothetical protein
MQTNCKKFFPIACRVAAFTFLVAGSATLMQAQQTPSVAPAMKAPVFLAALAAPDYAASYFGNSSSSSSSSSDALAAEDSFGSAASEGLQPPPRRRYGQPSYAGGNTNPDGSAKWTFLAGGGLGLPIGVTHKYETPSWGFQVGGGRNWSKTFGVMLQFDYDHFGLQGATLRNQSYLYDYYCTSADQALGICSPVTGILDGNNHVWSFTLNPTFTVPTEGSLGAYAVVGVGFYHKVTNFTVPSTGEYCDPYYGCYEYQANQTIDHYTSNAPGVSPGVGLTWKFSKFSNQRMYVEARYVIMLDSQRYGITASSSTATLNSYTGNNLYPQNSDRTTYIPIKFGIRF